MARMFVLVQTEVGRATEVASAAAALPGVTSAEAVTGPYDVVVYLDQPPGEERSPLHSIQQLSWVTRTLTCPALAAAY